MQAMSPIGETSWAQYRPRTPTLAGETLSDARMASEGPRATVKKRHVTVGRGTGPRPTRKRRLLINRSAGACPPRSYDLRENRTPAKAISRADRGTARACPSPYGEGEGVFSRSAGALGCHTRIREGFPRERWIARTMARDRFSHRPMSRGGVFSPVARGLSPQR